MVKSLNEFNREYAYQCYIADIQAAATKKKGSMVKSAVFYSILAIAVVCAFFWSGNGDLGKRFGPFAYHAVLTGSMQSVYPKGSLVVSKAVKTEDILKAGLLDGTDLVFVREDGTVIVHRILEIMEEYEDSGQRAFRTQGVENSTPDSFITYEGNVIGHVIWHAPYVGDILGFIAENVFWLAFGIALLFLLTSLLHVVFAKEEPKKKIKGQH